MLITISSGRRHATRRFIIDFDCKQAAGGNSGVYLRTPPDVHASSVSMEIQLLDDHAES